MKESTGSTRSCSPSFVAASRRRPRRRRANQDLGELEVSGLLGSHQRREPSVLARVRVGARMEQNLDHVPAPGCHGAVQGPRLGRELLVRRDRLDVRAMLDQGPCSLRAIEVSRVVQRGEAIRGPCAGSVAVLVEDRTNAIDVTERCRFEHVEHRRFRQEPFSLVPVAAVERVQDGRELSHRPAV